MSTFDGLKRAAVLVNSLSALDVYPDLADQLAGSSSSSDYASVPELSWQLIQRRRVQQFPDALLEQYDLMEARSFLGVFPEISRAWFTVDNRLYLWDYEAGKDLYAFDQQDQIIVSVGLVKPIPGVFLSGVDYVMVVATPLEITLLGVGLEGGQLTLYQTQMTTPAEGVSMTSIVGTGSGRIFMGGSNGNTYELAYQSQEGWFSRKCSKINHSSRLGYLLPSALKFGSDDPISSLVVDHERKLLYSLSAKSVIEIVHLGADGKGFTRIAKQTEVFRLAGQLSARPDLFDPKAFRIVSIHVLTLAESRAWQLVAVTSSGCRLYFTAYPRIAMIAQPAGMPGQPQQIPSNLDLVHVRLPPPDVVAPGKVHTATYSDGIFLAAFMVNDQKDALFGTGPDFRVRARNDPRKELLEVPSSLPVESRAITIVPGSAPSQGTISDLINQTSQPPKHYLVLTSSGIIFVVKERPLDVLLKLIAGLPSTYGAISRFFDHFGRDEAALMCLLIATEFPELQRQALELYSDRSGEAEVTVMQPTIAAPVGDVGRPFDVPSYNYSGRLNGLALFVSRLVRPVWSKPLLKMTVEKGQSVINPGPPLADFVAVKLRLAALRATLARLAEVRDPSRFPAGARAPDAAKGEQQLIHDVTRLLSETIEAIEFIEILHELNFTDACKQLPEVRRRDLSSVLTLEAIVTDSTAREKGVQIVHDLFKQNPAVRGTVDALSASFQQRCPSFVTNKDIVWFRGIELLSRALSLAGPERDNTVAESQSLWLREAQNMTPDRVAEIAQVHKQLKYYPGTIEIALAAAQATDPYNSGLKYSEGSDTSQHGKNAYDTRNRFYDVAIESLENRFAEPNERLQLQMISTCLKSTDLLFLFRIYDWLLQKGRKDLLLEGEPESLERFLVNSPNLEKSNLLWQFLVKSKQHLKASRVLVGLAEAKSPEIPLTKRVEYLSLAVSNAKSAAPNSQDDTGAILNYIQDRLEVAQVQLEIVRTIEKQEASGKLDTTMARESLAALHAELYDVTDLYKEFAAKFAIHDSILALLHVSKSGAHDLVTDTWSEVLKEADREGRASGTPPSDPRFVSERVQTLGMRFYPDENVFPLYALCKSLEDYGARNSVPDRAWVIRLMRNVGVPFRDLFEKYDVMFLDTKARGGPSAAHIGEAVCALIELWLQTDSKDLRSYIKAVNDTLTKMMLNGPNDRLRGIQDLLRSQFSVAD